jgi:hypothetical protein
MGRLLLRAAPLAELDLEPLVLDEERVRDHLSAAEELLFVGHIGPAVVATGAALEGAMRLRAGSLAGETATAGALLEALLATRKIADGEHDLLYRALSACDRLAHGYVPEPGHAVCGTEMAAVLVVAARLLERAAIA